MSDVVALDVAPEDDLSGFSRYLWHRKVSHRIVHVEDRQLLLVGNLEIAQTVKIAYDEWVNNPGSQPLLDTPESLKHRILLARLLQHLPVTMSFIVLSLLGFIVVYFNRELDWLRYLTFFNFERQDTSLVFSLAQGQYWRLITPIFLHFGVLHIAFNMALLWFIGQRIEILQGSFRLLVLALLIGLASNIGQAVFSGASIFGGMSGVVYGLIGYAWIWGMFRKDSPLHVPMALVYVSLFMLVLGFVGFVDMLGAGRVANAAHLSGLMVGCIIGAGAGIFSTSVNHQSK